MSGSVAIRLVLAALGLKLLVDQVRAYAAYRRERRRYPFRPDDRLLDAMGIRRPADNRGPCRSYGGGLQRLARTTLLDLLRHHDARVHVARNNRQPDPASEGRRMTGRADIRPEDDATCMARGRPISLQWRSHSSS